MKSIYIKINILLFNVFVFDLIFGVLFVIIWLGVLFLFVEIELREVVLVGVLGSYFFLYK